MGGCMTIILDSGNYREGGVGWGWGGVAWIKEVICNICAKESD